ncbi:MAG: sigma-54-dependent Fis family transcriptional regulator [Desulfobacterales bacterium]|nr:MAG: sigma-54-dependent Fis family transcriptional regulator [Desulfobacterales bacterium]
MGRILVVDDDQSILKVIRMRLEAEGHQVVTAVRPEDAAQIARDESFDLALIDLKLNGKDGIGLMQELQEIQPQMSVIILTAYGTIKSAVEAMKKGAYGYLTKPFDDRELLMQINNCLEKNSLSKEVERLRGLMKERWSFENIIGQSAKMQSVLTQVAHAAQSDANVCIEGESGTGKELIARSLHVAGLRKDGSFVAINCAAIPETLLESELFGYEKGAFTGASKSKTGLLAQAHNGTFFFDEISEMPLSMQAKLLRVLQEREFYPVGGSKTVKIDFRAIACSNKNLEELVAQGEFREDLYYRIHVILIKLPPLRERREDIPLLAEHFLKKFTRRMQKKIDGFSSSALQRLLLHSWPGNIRELENTVESAVAMATANIITAEAILPTQSDNDVHLKPLKGAKEDFEKNYLKELLEFTGGNISQAAKLAGKYRADLYELIRKYDLDIDQYRKT